MTEQKDVVYAYTDGACSRNPGPGGWGVLLRRNGVEKELKGGVPETTNQRMELQAAIEALKAMKRSVSVVVVSDSQYVVKGMTEWLEGWKARGWRNANKKPVANQDLWEELELAAKGHAVDWQWVKGHSGHVYNERADRLAVAGITI